MTLKKATFFVLAYVVSFFSTPAHAQAGEISKRVMMVENNLMTQKGFSNHAGKRYNIYTRMALYKIPSVSIAVIYNGKIDWARTYGFSDIESAQPADVTTKYQSVSASKCINSLCILRMVEEGKLTLDSDFRQSLKSWRFQDDKFPAEKISIANLLSHTSGFGSLTLENYDSEIITPTLIQTLNGQQPARNMNVKLLEHPGRKFLYSYDGFVISAKLLEDLRQAPYDTVVKNTLFDPIEMNNSSFEEALKKQPGYATGYDGNDEAKGFLRYPPSLGLWSTPTDLAKMIIAIQQSLKGKQKGLLSDSLARRMLTPTVKGPFKASAACGFFIDTVGGEVYFSDEGDDLGFKTLLIGGLNNGKGLFIMLNKEYQSEFANEILRSVAESYNWEGFSTLKQETTKK